ncbi:MAG TPA: molybdate ABC transporter substrate-binding protein [Anaeromyxobacter sp.]|nr:molybdate ABC transporter substrate-binding protein [Anaeromyxobacter sp.]
MNRLPTLVALASLALLPPAAGVQAAEPARKTVSVAAAANLKAVMTDLKAGFEAEHPEAEVSVTTGASGNFFTQIQNGAPFDVFFSADRDYPQKAVAAGLGAPSGEVVYAIGKLVVWAPRDSPLPLEQKGLAAVADPAVKKLAIANPAVAPYGRAAEAALRTAGVYDAVKDRLVLGENVSQTAQFAQSGAADAALIPLSLTFSPELKDGKVLVVPPGSYPAQEQSAIVLKGAKEAALAQAFVSFVTGPRGREILRRYGYSLP